MAGVPHRTVNIRHAVKSLEHLSPARTFGGLEVYQLTVTTGTSEWLEFGCFVGCFVGCTDFGQLFCESQQLAAVIEIDRALAAAEASVTTGLGKAFG